MAALFLIISQLVLLAAVNAGKYTVTDEVWFEVEVKDMDGPGQDFRGRFTVAVFGETAPMTTMNFVALARGYTSNSKTGSKLHYKNSPIHRVVPDFVIQMGDVVNGDGTGGRSIYGERFNDEAFILSHRSAGWVSMANHGTDTNGSQFFIMLSKARWLDGKHVVFGKVIKGMNVVNTVGEVPSDPNTAVPKKRIRIVDCGVNEVAKYDLTEGQLDSNEDL